MGGGENEITISAELDPKGFEAGTQKLTDAVNDFGKAVDAVFERIKKYIGELDLSEVEDAIKDADLSDVGEELKEGLEAPNTEAMEETAAAVNRVGKEAKNTSSFLTRLRTAFTRTFGGVNNLVKKAAGGLTSMFRQTERGATVASSSIKRMAGTLIGVSGIYGILSKAVNAYMSENQKLAAQMNGIWTALGNLIGPIIEQIIQWITTAVSYFLEFLRLLGVTSKTASQLSKTAKGAGGDLKKTLAGFDELNLLSDNRSGGPNGQLKDVDPADWMKEIIELLKNKMWDDATDLIIEKMNAMIAAFRTKAAELGETVGEWLDDVLHMVARIINEVNWGDIGSGIGEFLVNAFRDVNGEDIGAILVAKITIGLRILIGFLATPRLGETLGKQLSGMIIGALNSLAAVFKDKEKMNQIGVNIREFFENLDWDGIASAVGDALHTMWDAAVEILRGILKGEETEDPPIIKALENLENAVKSFCDNVGPVAKDVWENILKPFGSWLLDTLLPDIINGISLLIEGLGIVVAWLGDKAPGALKVFMDSGTEQLAWMTGVQDLVEETGETVVGTANETADAVENATDRIHKSTTTHGTVLGELADASADAARTAEDAAEAYHNAYDSVSSGADEAASATQTAMDDATAAIEGARQSAETAADDIGDSMDGVSQSVDETRKQIEDAMEDSVKAFEDAKREIESAMSDMTDSIESEMTSLKGSASMWGRDLINSYTVGIISGEGWLFSEINSIMQGIYSYMHFSEPDKGPLANFHTWAPDMMKGFAEGIEKNKSKVMEAVGSVASGISGAMSGDFGIGKIDLSGIDTVMDGFADRIVSGFESMLERLQSIADNVTFTMPAMASGGVVPYGVSGSMGMNDEFGGVDIVTQISSAVYDAVSDALANSTAMNGQRTVVLEVNGREFCRATYNDQQAVAKEHGISLVTNG